MTEKNISIKKENVNSAFLPELATLSTQVATSAFCRQVGSNIKSAMDLHVGIGNYIKQNGGFFKALTHGYLPRFGNNFVSMMPASEIGRATKEHYPNSPYTAMCLSSLWESIIGSGLEVKASAKVFKAAKVDISSFYTKAFQSGYTAILVPNFFRNFCGWYGAYAVIGSGNEVNIGHRACAGFFAGIISTPFDTIAVRSIRNAAQDLSNSNPLNIGIRALKKTIIDSAKNPLEFCKIVSRGAIPRALPSAISALVFSKEGGDAILDFFKPASDKNSSLINNFPGSSISKASVQKAQEDQEKNR